MRNSENIFFSRQRKIFLIEEIRLLLHASNSECSTTSIHHQSLTLLVYHFVLDYVALRNDTCSLHFAQTICVPQTVLRYRRNALTECRQPSLLQSPLRLPLLAPRSNLIVSIANRVDLLLFQAISENVFELCGKFFQVAQWGPPKGPKGGSRPENRPLVSPYVKRG